MYDAAIVGAGPAGSTAGRQLAKQGFNVCLIDKNTFPRDKPCGGGVSPRLLLDFPSVSKRSSEFVKSVSHAAVLHSPNRRVILRGKADMVMTLRTDFDRLLFRMAIEEGAHPVTPFRAVSVKTDRDMVRVTSSQGAEIRARVVIGADGVNSIVARQTGLNPRWPHGSLTACQVVEFLAKESDIVDTYGSDREYHLYTDVGGLPGYGWLLPKLTTVNLGLGIVAEHAQGLPALFALFSRMLRRDGVIPWNVDLSLARGALVPTAGPIPMSVAHRCLLAGDSAGMVNPLTGGGIAYAMRAGRLAGIILAIALEDDRLDVASLSRYQRAWQQDFGHEVKGQLAAQKAFTSPFADLLFEIGGRDAKIQAMVASLMSESNASRATVGRIALRALWVCLRESLQ